VPDDEQGDLETEVRKFCEGTAHKLGSTEQTLLVIGSLIPEASAHVANAREHIHLLLDSLWAIHRMLLRGSEQDLTPPAPPDAREHTAS
jgi:hypothetical protein